MLEGGAHKVTPWVQAQQCSRMTCMALSSCGRRGESWWYSILTSLMICQGKVAWTGLVEFSSYMHTFFAATCVVFESHEFWN